MSVPDAGSTRDARYWLVPLSRSIVALLVAVAITFSADHSAPVGFFAFGSFAIASGVVLAVLGPRVTSRRNGRGFFVAQGVVSVLAGIGSLVLNDAGTDFLLFIVSAWAAIAGFLELYSGLRARRRITHGKDWIFVGAVTALFAVVVLLIPAGFEQTFTGPDGVERVLTAAVITVGSIGAYAAIVGVYLAIAAFSLKWAAQPAAQKVEQ